MANRTRRIVAPSGAFQIERGHPLNEGLNACWLLNENGGGVINDLTGRGRQGVLTNGPLWDNTGLRFNGTTAFVHLGNGDIITTPAFTISAWVWVGSLGVAGTLWTILSKWDSVTSKRGFFLGMNTSGAANGNVVMGVSTDGVNAISTATTSAGVIVNQWCHIAATWSGSTVLIYLNGKAQVLSFITTTGSAGVPFSSNIANELGAGVGVGAANSFFPGRLRNVRLYNRALSSADIRALASHEYIGLLASPRRQIAQAVSAGTPTVRSSFLTF